MAHDYPARPRPRRPASAFRALPCMAIPGDAGGGKRAQVNE